MRDAAASMAGPAPERVSPVARTRRLHPVPVRIMHWTNAVAMIVMITSGWGIYDDSVIIRGLHFSPSFRLGSWAPESLLWHFAGMWLLAANGLAYLTYGVVTGRLRERLLPIRVRDLVQTVRDTLHFHVSHEDLTVYNAVQKVLYIVVILAGVSQVVTGLAIWKPVQFAGLVSLLGGFQSARVLHFAGMSVIVGFLVVHVALSLLVPQTLWAMLTGGPRVVLRGRGGVLPAARGGVLPAARGRTLTWAHNERSPQPDSEGVQQVSRGHGEPPVTSGDAAHRAGHGKAVPVAGIGAATSGATNDSTPATTRSEGAPVAAPGDTATAAPRSQAAPVAVPRDASPEPAGSDDAATVAAGHGTPAAAHRDAAPGAPRGRAAP